MCCAFYALRYGFIALAFMLFGCSWVVTTERSTRCPDNFEVFFFFHDCVWIIGFLKLIMKITIVCNYKVYPQNSCPVEDDRRGVSVCPNICLKEETLYNP